MTDEDQENINLERDTGQANDDTSDGEVQRREIILSPPISTAVQAEVQLTTVEARRECIVCMETILLHPRSIQPCPCGYWAHHNCLITSIQVYEANHPGCDPLGCKFCDTPYNIGPRKNWIVKLFETVSVTYGTIRKLGFCVISVVLVDATFASIGMAVLKTVYEREEIGELLMSLGSIEAVAICKSIPLFSIVVSCVPWENTTLRCLRRWSRLPVVGWLFPTFDPRVREEKRSRTRLGVLVGGLLLPWFANMFGVVLFSAVQSRVQRLLLGGATFLSLKGVLYMYYRQKLYARQCLLAVEAYRSE